MKAIFNKFSTSKSGYLVIYSLIAITIILLISITVVRVSTTENRNTVTEKESQKALYMAESAIECVKQHDKVLDVFVNPAFDSTNTLPTPGSPDTITCDGTPKIATFARTEDVDFIYYTWEFKDADALEIEDKCADVTMVQSAHKSTQLNTRINITARGYNSCNPSAVRQRVSKEDEEFYKKKNEIPFEALCTNADVELLIDNSGSIGGTNMELVKDAAKAVAQNILDLEDTETAVGLTRFSSSGSHMVNLTQDYTVLEPQINSLSSGGRTHLTQGLDLAITDLINNGDWTDASRKHFIFLFTDGLPNQETVDCGSSNGCTNSGEIDTSYCQCVRNQSGAEADDADSRSIEIITLYVGSEVSFPNECDPAPSPPGVCSNWTFLSDRIATSPSLFFQVDDFDSLQNFIDTTLTCEGEPAHGGGGGGGK